MAANAGNGDASTENIELNSEETTITSGSTGEPNGQVETSTSVPIDEMNSQETTSTSVSTRGIRIPQFSSRRGALWETSIRVPTDDPSSQETTSTSVSTREPNGQVETSTRVPIDDPSSQETTSTSVSTRDKSEYDRESKRLRAWLKFCLYSAVKLSGNTCSIHVWHSLFLLLQICKIVLISCQMFNFGHDRGTFSDVVNRGHLTLRHQLLKNWDATRETLAYPPAKGDFAVYKIEDLESGIDYAVKGYYNAEVEAVGFFQRINDDNIKINVKYFDFPGFKDTNVTEGVIIADKTFSLDKSLLLGNQFDLVKEFERQGLKQPMKRMLSLELRFSIHSIRVYEKERRARCLYVQGWVTFNDLDNNGQVIVNLETLTSRIKCEKMNITLRDWALENTSEMMGAVLISVCYFSLVASAAYIILKMYLLIKTKSFMKKYYKKCFNDDTGEKDLPFSQYWRLITFWDTVALLSDICTLYGTIWIVYENQDNEWIVETLDSYTVWLSIGCIFTWIRLMRFFKFFGKFYLLFSTLYRASGNVMSYLICVTGLFIGYWMAGFLVLSPYHVKFRTPAIAAETLISVMNGDEIFTTLAILENEKTGGVWVWWFARFYLWSFIAIFTIIAFNLLIVLFTSAYESVKDNYNRSHNDGGQENVNKPRTLSAFMNEDDDITYDIKCGCIKFEFLTIFNYKNG